MKKSLLFLITALFVLVLAACGNESSTGSTNEESTNETSGSTEKEVITIGYQKGNTINILKRTWQPRCST